MKNLMLFIAIGFAASGCSNKSDADAERQVHSKDMYRVPPPSNPAEDQWAKPGSMKPKEKGTAE